MPRPSSLRPTPSDQALLRNSHTILELTALLSLPSKLHQSLRTQRLFGRRTAAVAPSIITSAGQFFFQVFTQLISELSGGCLLVLCHVPIPSICSCVLQICVAFISQRERS